MAKLSKSGRPLFNILGGGGGHSFISARNGESPPNSAPLPSALLTPHTSTPNRVFKKPSIYEAAINQHIPNITADSILANIRVYYMDTAAKYVRDQTAFLPIGKQPELDLKRFSRYQLSYMEYVLSWLVHQKLGTTSDTEVLFDMADKRLKSDLAILNDVLKLYAAGHKEP